MQNMNPLVLPLLLLLRWSGITFINAFSDPRFPIHVLQKGGTSRSIQKNPLCPFKHYLTTTKTTTFSRENAKKQKPRDKRRNKSHADEDEDDDTLIIKDLVKNLFSVCAHIQNPDLYSPMWANRVSNTLQNGSQQQQQSKLITSNPVQKGDILSLYPLDALGLRTPKNTNNNGIPKKKPSKIMSKRSIQKTKKTTTTTTATTLTMKDFIVFDQDKDGIYFQNQLSQSLKKSQPLQTKYRITVPLGVYYHQNENDNSQHHEFYELFIDVNPTNRQTMINSGWMGHTATKQHQEHESLRDAVNCKVLPLPNATPLCALVATSDMDQGTELIVGGASTYDDKETELDETLMNIMATKYKDEIQELGAYLKLAYQPPLQPFYTTPQSPPPAANNDESDTTCDEDTVSLNVSEMNADFQFPFHSINLDYPGLRYLYRDPDILIVDNFLSDEECDRITTNAQSHLIPCVIKHPKTGAVQEDPSRTSTNANMPQSDVPSIVDKIVSLTNCPDATYLETLQILKYTKGQFFYPHTDGFQGPTTACGFEQSGRLATIFCYLNDVPEGGETRFPKLSINSERSNESKVLKIAPRKGMAVIHFPATTGFEEDLRTEHEGSAAIDDKWLLVTWMWKDPRIDPQYADCLFSSIMGAAESPNE